MEQGSDSTAGSKDQSEQGGSVKARNIRRENNTNSRRYSASFIRSFREDTNSFRSNITISSTASSPGTCTSFLRDEIDPSTYSFTTALQALQARSAYNNCWECLSPEGLGLNSKWNEAEKYICNPLSGEFPVECLSAKTLSGRSKYFPNTNNYRITMSAPLVYSNLNNNSNRRRHSQTLPHNVAQEETRHHFPIQEERMEAMELNRRDKGTQSTPPPEELSSSSLSPAASTPSIIERSLNRCGVEPGDSPISNPKLTMSQQHHVVKVIETEEKSEEEKEGKVRIRRAQEEKTQEKKKDDNKQKQRRGGCLPWMSKRQRHNNNSSNNNRDKHRPKKSFYLPNLKGCSINY